MKRIFSLVIAAIFFTGAWAQVSDTTDLGDITIKTRYKPNVQESVKIDIEPELEEPRVEAPEYTYRFPAIDFKPNSVYSPIDPVYIKPEQMKDLYDNYIEIGGGNFLTSYVDASIHNTQDKYYSYGLKVKHHAASASRNPEQALFSDNRITAFGKREKGNDLSGIIDYRRNVVHYYGYLREDTTERPLGDINQIYNDINADLLWSHSKRGIKNDIGFNFNLFDNLGEQENSYSIQFDNEFKMGRNKLFLNVGGTYTMLNEMRKYNRLFVDIEPSYAFRYKKVDLQIGLLATVFNDSNTSAIYPAPKIHAETYLVPDKLRAYLDITGGLQKNTLRSLAYENRFLGNDFNIENPYQTFKIAAGMNGNFKRFIEYGVTLSQEQRKNQFLFVNDTNELRNFTVVYDDINIFNFSAEMKFDVSQNVDLGFRGNAYAYSTTTESTAWHLPTYDGALFATVRVADKIYINGSYYATSNRKARDLSGKEYDLASINDINVGAEYRYKKNISAFLNFQNILNQRYAIWNQYEAQGLNILAGVTFSL